MWTRCTHPTRLAVARGITRLHVQFSGRLLLCAKRHWHVRKRFPQSHNMYAHSCAPPDVAHVCLRTDLGPVAKMLLGYSLGELCLVPVRPIPVPLASSYHLKHAQHTATIDNHVNSAPFKVNRATYQPIAILYTISLCLHGSNRNAAPSAVFPYHFICDT